MGVHLYRVILPVTDIAAARRFYETLLGVQGEMVSGGRCYFDCGGTVLACYDPLADGDAMGEGWRLHSHQYFYFSVDDLEASVSAARLAGALDIGPIGHMPWGETLFYAKDPFDNLICLVQAGTEFKGAR